MMPSASGWAHVTMYYGAFYAASALLGMFGAWKLPKRNVIDVVLAQPGAQEFQIRAEPTTYNGSHRMFWDFFYSNVTSLVAWVDTALVPAISPVMGSRVWLTDTRNTVNYDSHASCDLIATFGGGFRRSSFPTSLPGVINTQFSVLEGILKIAADFAKEFGLTTDALNAMSASGDRRSRIRELVLDANPVSLGLKAKRRAMLG